MGNYDFELDLHSVNTMSVINSWITDGSKVLEIGPANGRLTKYLTQNRGCEVTIVEIDEHTGREAMQYAHKSFIGPIEGNVLNFRWVSDEKYDFIIMADVLEHLSDPALVLEKCQEVLKENGNILVSIPNVAHNSILIDLYNDKFIYDEVGLLDYTHVHFFTYSTFAQMAEETGWQIYEQKPIYSRVGWNEIDNHYTDIPHEVAKCLRNRRSGSVYQYVLNLIPKHRQQITSLTLEQIDYLEEEYREQAELSCFIWKELHEVEPTERKKVLYNIAQKNKCKIEIGEKIKRLRLDLLEESALIDLLNVEIEIEGNKTIPVSVKHSNATTSRDGLYYFNDNDPWLELDIEKYINKRIESVQVEFSVLDNNISQSIKMGYDLFAGKLLKLNGIDKENAQIQRENTVLQQRLNESIQYNNHLEQDIAKLKNEVYDIREKSSEYSKHLEGDIQLLQEQLKQKEQIIQNLQEAAKCELEEREKYINHLEKDISVLQKDILSEREESASYIKHLEKDIEELRKVSEELNLELFDRDKNV